MFAAFPVEAKDAQSTLMGASRCRSLSQMALLFALSCSSPTPPSAPGRAQGSVNGTVSGHVLGVTDGVGVTDPTSAIPYVDVVLGNRTNLCPLLQAVGSTAAATGQVANLTSLELRLYDTRTTTFNTGTFPVPPPNPRSTPTLEADVLFLTNDALLSDAGAGCDSPVFQWATSGTVTVT
jgi:hypothetical protein